jgi:hypothetical protein
MVAWVAAAVYGVLGGFLLALALHYLERPWGITPRWVFVETALGTLIALASAEWAARQSGVATADGYRLLVWVAFIACAVPIVPWQLWLYWEGYDRRMFR